MRRALWSGLRSAFGKALPERPGLKLVYQDMDGDMLLLQPDEPWAPFVSTARLLRISCK